MLPDESLHAATMLHLVLSLLLLRYASASAPSGPWDAFNYAPKSKTVYPAGIHSISGTVNNAQRLVHNSGSATLSGNGSWVALDFGVEVRPLTMTSAPAI